MEPSPLAIAARKRLLRRRSELARRARGNETDEQALREQEPDWQDLASNEELADVLLLLSGQERREVTEIDAAVARIDAGRWGQCERCGQSVGRERLAALPEARLCVTCASARS